MTIRNLDQCFRPGSVAVVGASPKPQSVGSIVLNNIRSGGFAGPVYPVNPKYDRIDGLACYARASDLPQAPDVAIIVTPPQVVPGVIAELGARGCTAAVVITAGVGAASGLRQAMLDAARPHLMRVVGPNTIGMLSPLVRLNASFAHLPAQAGKLGLISQSGAIVSSILDWAAADGVGFSQLISLGDMADVDVGDCLNWLAADDATSTILMYLESVPEPRKFMSAARAAARIKPVIAVKPGRHGEAAQAAMTHTGALAGSDTVIEAALHRAGVIRVRNLEQLFSAAEVTTRFRPLTSGRLGIVTNGGGAGVLAVDDLLDLDGTLATLSPETLAGLDAALPATWSHANPVDIIGDAPPERYGAAVAAVAADAAVDALLVMNCPTALSSPLQAAETVGRLATNGLIGGKPTVACWLGKQTAEPARVVLREAGIVAVDTPAAAAEAVDFLTRWSRLRQRLERVPPSAGAVRGDAERVRDILGQVARDGRTLLTEPEAKAVIAAYGIPVPETHVVVSDEEVGTAAADLLTRHEAVVVKLYSRQISHKSDIGGVVLDITSREQAMVAAAGIRDRVKAAGLGAFEGFTVQPMITRRHAHELLLGLKTDPSFGPVIVFGAGGVAVEVVRDTATGLVPLDEVLAGDLIDGTRIARLLAGYRDRPPAARESVVAALLALSQLAVEQPAIVAIDVNPLLVDDKGAIALDARIEIDGGRLREPAPNHRLAVRPYPSGWDSRADCEGRSFELRPMRPADAALYPRFLERVSAEDMRLRFLVPTQRLSREVIARLSQLDYDRDIAFVALEADTGDLAGICRYSSDPDHERAEFGILVRSDLQGIGLGSALMRRLLDYARADGLRRIDGLILRENRDMLDLAARMGFVAVPQATAGDPIRMSLSL
ncbi:bifunctional acetate--CoA ligase family protein/GNAT family N-acetyltransferase [Devosia sp.]|uniref:bifunctional acetate--CoA ligase family protein/GNAT family N-acetyltransferase n=1 Tax=Devosia sp. TaxID=1871048 RepID=UPI001AC9FFCD|nr:bifunctional acetate--CoA ligase family protein/GNAT family N-acetyltransferase [Devosia sp.]MBN9310940.1 bifunctional acetate--CoA ligase family protein/GNAT family N-acetyltransferase [Devosia sp.]